MEKILEEINLIITNAKKSIGKPYTINTIAEKVEVLKHLELSAEYILAEIQDETKREKKLLLFTNAKNYGNEMLKILQPKRLELEKDLQHQSGR